MKMTQAEIDDETFDVLNYKIDTKIETETVMAPEEYEWEYFPDAYGGMAVPVPKGARKPQTMTLGRSIDGYIEVATHIPDSRFRDEDGMPVPVDIRLYTDDGNEVILDDSFIANSYKTNDRTRLQFVCNK